MADRAAQQRDYRLDHYFGLNFSGLVLIQINNDSFLPSFWLRGITGRREFKFFVHIIEQLCGYRTLVTQLSIIIMSGNFINTKTMTNCLIHMKSGKENLFGEW